MDQSIDAALVKTGDHIEVGDSEFRVISSERAGDMMWMIVGYTSGGPTRNMAVAPDSQFKVLKRAVPYSKDFDEGKNRD